MIKDLDAYRIGWELIDHADYSYWGGKRAVVVQFSRGCPHPCNYCGQRGFWTQWRRRDPVKFAAEIARLHREHGVEVFNFADENPTSSKKDWKAFLEALIAERVSVTLVGSTRADDIVRDRDHLHLYKAAGVERFLMGMENTDEAVLAKIKKGGSTTTDREAIRLMREHNMLSMATWVVGFEEETDRDYWRTLRQLLSYDPDQIQSVYVTPHRWTPFFALAAQRKVIQTDQGKWDYKHQVLATRHVPPWRVFLWVKAIEFILQARPKAIWRLWTLKDPKIRHAQRWYYQMGRRVWFHEVLGFLFRDHRLKHGPTVEEFWGATLEAQEEALAKPVRRTAVAAKAHPLAAEWRPEAISNDAAGRQSQVDCEARTVTAGHRRDLNVDVAGRAPRDFDGAQQAFILDLELAQPRRDEGHQERGEARDQQDDTQGRSGKIPEDRRRGEQTGQVQPDVLPVHAPEVQPPLSQDRVLGGQRITHHRLPLEALDNLRRFEQRPFPLAGYGRA